MSGSADILDVLRDSEVCFSDANSYKPTRVIKVPTDAPVQSMSVDITPSSGVFTMPEGSPFADRFIVWRSIGQNLFLEERSLHSVVKGNCLCFNFTRSAVIPGTSIAVFDNVLSLVVPTQSSIHRFYARLVFDPIGHDSSRSSVRSLLSQFGDQERLREFHESHLIATQGHPIKSCISQRMGDTKVVYVMWEGILVHVHMPSDTRSDCEETLLRESNLIRRLMGGKGSDVNGALDGTTLGGMDKKASNPLFYVVYRDLTVRAWHAENRGLIHAFDINDMITTRIDTNNDVSNVLIRCAPDGRNTMIAVGVSTANHTLFVLMRDNGLKMERIAEVHSNVSTPLLDISLWRVTDGSMWRMFSLWNDFSGRSSADYKLHHTSFSVIVNADGALAPDCTPTWRTVQALPTRNALSSPDETVDDLRKTVFNRDNHTFEVVSRAVQIVCQGRVFEASGEDWRGMREFVDAFLRTPEFDIKYGQSGSVSHEDATFALMRKLAHTCSELEGASRGALGLFTILSPYAQLVGVVQQNRLSCVCESLPTLLAHLDVEGFAVHSRQMSLLAEVIETAVAWSVEEDDVGDDEAVTIPSVAIPQDLSKWIGVLEKVLQYVVIPTKGFDSIPEDTSSFGGAFTAGYISACLKRRVRAAQATSHNILQFCRLVMALPKKNSRLETGRSLVPGLYDKSLALSQVYKQIHDELSVQFVCTDAHQSVCSWLTSGEGISDLLREGGERVFEAMDSSGDGDSQTERPYNGFVERTVAAALRCLTPSNKHLILCKLLAKQKKYIALKRVLQLCNKSRSQQSSVASFYQGIAYSGCNQPDKALTAFSACLPSARSGDPFLAGALADCGEKIDKGKLVGRFYLQTLRTLSEHGHSVQVIEMSKGAIQDMKGMEGVRENTEILERVHITLFQQEADRRDWKSALAAIHTCTNPESRLQTLRELLSRLLAQREWKEICELDFGDLAHHVASILHARAINESANITPNTYELLSAYHIARNDFFKAATAMYEWAVRIREEPQSPELLSRRRDALAAAANFVSLLGEENYIFFHHQIEVQCSELDDEVCYEKRGGRYEDDSMRGESEENEEDADGERRGESAEGGKTRVEKVVAVIDEELLDKEWSLCNARCALLPLNDVPPVAPQELLEELVEGKKYDLAFSFARQFELSPCSILSAITREAIVIDCDPALKEMQYEWIRDNQSHVCEKMGTGNHWDVLRGLLDAALRVCPSDTRPLHSVLDTVLSHGFPVPCWLEAQYMEFDIGSYLRTLVDYESLQSALTAMSKYLEPMQSEVRSVQSRVLLPYAVMDEIVKMAKESRKEECRELLKVVTDKLRALQKRMQGFSESSRFTMMAM